jgi:hypothetical protein
VATAPNISIYPDIPAGCRGEQTYPDQVSLSPQTLRLRSRNNAGGGRIWRAGRPDGYHPEVMFARDRADRTGDAR